MMSDDKEDLKWPLGLVLFLYTAAYYIYNQFI